MYSYQATVLTLKCLADRGTTGIAHRGPVGTVASPLDALPVLVGQRARPQVDRMERADRAVVGPSAVEVLVGGHPDAVLVVAEGEIRVELLACQPEVRRVAGQQEGIEARIDRRLDDGQETVRPAPAVVASPPLAVEVFAHLAGQTHVVGEDAAVLVGSLLPSREVVDHPGAQGLIARVHEGVRHLACRVQVERHVPARRALVHLLDDLGEDVVVSPGRRGRRERDGRQVLERRVVAVEYTSVSSEILGCDHEARSLASGLRGADDAQLWIEVGCERILAGVHARETIRPLALDHRVGLGEPEEVVEEVGLAVVHPVVVAVELALDLTVLGPLPGDRVPHLPGRFVDRFVAADAVEEREVHEGFVRVVGAVHPRPLVAPDEGSVLAGVTRNELVGDGVERRDDLAGEQRPARRNERGVDFDARQLVHESSPSIPDAILYQRYYRISERTSGIGDLNGYRGECPAAH